MTLDAHVDVVTPENISFHYEVAGPFQRAPAYLVDLAIRLGIALGIGLLCLFLLGMAGLLAVGLGVLLVAWFVLGYFYGGLFETYWNGQTPGKRLMGLRVLTVDGQPINALQAVLRNVLRDVDAMPMPLAVLVPQLDFAHWIGVYGVGLITMMLTDRYQRLGDLACGTMVVIEQGWWLEGVTRVDDPRAAQLAALVPADFQVSRALGRALSAYVERRRYFTPLRRADIARHVGAPLVERFGLPPDTSHDLLLCALYHRTFIADRGESLWEPPSRGVPASIRRQTA
jgi:uncharacterized RDD family membrane protein YckC